MQDYYQSIEYKDQKYKLVFNLNTMEIIQEKYGTLDKWGALTDGKGGEPNAKAVIFGFAAMLNEGIDMDNEDNGTNNSPLTLKQVGRMITAIGLTQAATALNQTVIESTKSDVKNA